MCALAGNHHQQGRNDQKLSKSICDGDNEGYILWSWSPRWCASPASSHEFARRAGAFVVHGCFITLRWVSRLPPVMTIHFQILAAFVIFSDVYMLGFGCFDGPN
jgi:hypothetical protein